MKPDLVTKSALGGRRLKFLAALAVGWMLVSGSELGAQDLSAPKVRAKAPAIRFEVLAVTVGSGSRSRRMDGAAIHFGARPEVAEAGSVSDGGPWTTTSVTSRIDLGAERPVGTRVASVTPIVGASGTAEPPKEAKSAAPAKETRVVAQAKDKKAEAAPPKKEAEAGPPSIVAALEQWHRQVLVNYTYNIGSLADPFLPIKDVRGRPDQITPEEEANLPPILRLELNQLKLVAITVVSGGSGAALASFEDGAGVSYILRQGDQIGRHQGRIVAIEPGRVVIEEAPARGASGPQVTEMKLDALSDTSGLTRSGGIAW